MKISAIYPGSFDPVTLGHQDVITRASRIVSCLTVAVAEGAVEKKPLFSVVERVDLLRKVVGDLPNVRVEPFAGLLVDYAREMKCRVLIRGLRAFSDFEYEFQMALVNRRMAPDIETLFLMPKEEYSYVSSSVVREVAALGGDVSRFVAPPVREALSGRPGPSGE